MSSHTTKIDSRNIAIKKTKSCSDCFYQIPGDKLPFYFSKPTSDVDFLNDVNIHNWTLLGLYRDSDAEVYNVPYDLGGFKYTVYDQLYEAYNTTGFYTISIDDTMFRMGLENRIKLSVPITGATDPSISGLTNLTFYSGLIRQNNTLTPISSGPASLVVGDVVKSEYDLSISNVGIGQKFIPGTNPGQYDPNEPSSNYYDSGIVLLWSDDIDYSGATTGVTWDTAWSAGTKYTYGGARLAKYSGQGTNGTDGYNQAVGAVDLYSGNAFIWHPEVVPYINTAIGTGSTVTGMTFSTSDASMIVKDYDTEMTATINIVAEPYSYTTTTNPSMAEAVKNDPDCSKKVWIHQVCLMDDNGIPVAYATLDKAVEKPIEEYLLLTTEINIDGGIQDPPYDTYSLTTYGC
jgi:hypothetical protein